MNAKQKQLRHADYVDHILDAASQIYTYIGALNKDDFLKDRETQDAVILKILVIGKPPPKFSTSTKILLPPALTFPGTK